MSEDPRLVRARQLRADAVVMRKAAKVRSRNKLLCDGYYLTADAASLESQAADLEAEVRAEVDAKAAAEVDEWAEAKRWISAIEQSPKPIDPPGIENPMNVLSAYACYLQSRVAELEAKLDAVPKL